MLTDPSPQEEEQTGYFYNYNDQHSLVSGHLQGLKKVSIRGAVCLQELFP